MYDEKTQEYWTNQEDWNVGEPIKLKLMGEQTDNPIPRLTRILVPEETVLHENRVSGTVLMYVCMFSAADL